MKHRIISWWCFSASVSVPRCPCRRMSIQFPKTNIFSVFFGHSKTVLWSFLVYMCTQFVYLKALSASTRSDLLPLSQYHFIVGVFLYLCASFLCCITNAMPYILIYLFFFWFCVALHWYIQNVQNAERQNKKITKKGLQNIVWFFSFTP